jgi:hypothetical protein
MKTKLIGIVLAGGMLLAGDLLNTETDGVVTTSSFIAAAGAVIGRPATPGSVAGVARRTTRRVVRRSTIYVAALPAGCVVTNINGARYWLCGGTYYQASGGRYVVVYVD